MDHCCSGGRRMFYGNRDRANLSGFLIGCYDLMDCGSMDHGSLLFWWQKNVLRE